MWKSILPWGKAAAAALLNPTTKVFLDEGATAEMELTQISGVDEADRLNEATLGPAAFYWLRKEFWPKESKERNLPTT